MKFEKKLNSNGNIYEWLYIKRNPFTKKIKFSISLANIENNTLYKKELSFLPSEMLDNAVFFEGGYSNLNLLKKFSEKEFTIAYINSDEINKYNKLGFNIIINQKVPCYDYCAYRVNKGWRISNEIY